MRSIRSMPELSGKIATVEERARFGVLLSAGASTKTALPRQPIAPATLVVALLFAGLMARYDPINDTVSYPYFVDEFSSAPQPAPLQKGLIEQVLRSGEALFATQETLEGIIQRGGIDTMDTPFINWLGVPIMRGERAIGLLGIKSYTDDIQFSELEKQLLFFVAHQIAGALERTKAWDE